MHCDAAEKSNIEMKSHVAHQSLTNRNLEHIMAHFETRVGQ